MNGKKKLWKPEICLVHSRGVAFHVSSNTIVYFKALRANYEIRGIKERDIRRVSRRILRECHDVTKLYEIFLIICHKKHGTIFRTPWQEAGYLFGALNHFCACYV